MTEGQKPIGFDAKAFEIGKVIHNHTIQFLEKGGKYGYKPYGTGVLVFIDGKCIILTAAHVTKNSGETQLYVNSSKGVIPVVGDLRETDLDKDKTTDLAYIILHDKIAAILVETYEFLPLNKIVHSHKPMISNQYLVVGYPERNIRADTVERKVHSGSSIFLLTMSKEKVYEHYGYDVNKDYILDFAGRGIDLKTDQKSEKIDDPNGMSGCGLWLLTEKSGTDTFELQYHLIGIMTEFRKGKYHVLIGNRIEIIISALIQLEGLNIK